MTGRPWWNLEPCGTRAAYQRHARRGELPCRECLDAHTAYTTAWRRARVYAMRREEAEVAAWRAEHEQSLRRQQEADVRTLVALLAEMFHSAPRRRERAS